MTDERDPAPAGFSGPRRALVLTGATLVVLLVGAAIGMLITTARVDRAPSAPSPESVDVGFAQDMQVHHLQAVTMAGIARDHTTDPEVHTLAFDIESTQLGQASEMAGWLTVWGRPELPDAGRGHMAWMTGSGHGHGDATTAAGGSARMPGMATTEELNRLRTVSGKELDVLFLQLMLRHHQGAIPMAQFAADRAGTGYVRDLAQKILSGQTAEVTLMTTMLAARGATPLPPPN
ncbi:MAG TPA: DUF305 domain-containing protein [Actinophytocola sp.]|uniref:DUF305 domain-containing protein n=1 Tax=Actinophytocola sp. TaxID=1872138 RepID=UPI002DDD2156|nr:DUF305 domain-containing protein [Actinophytocola sp.]HEV2778300.1 DUF305 domain-containing protein [Actinophytocola sp.]